MYEEMHTPNLKIIDEVNDKISKLGVFFDPTKFNRRNARKDIDEVTQLAKLKAAGIHDTSLF